jgi:hypothetical protein
MRLALIAVAVLAATTGCKADKKSGDEGGGGAAARKDLMTPQEKQRGEDACNTYVKQLCDCAAARPDDAEMKGRCERKSLPQALELVMGVIEDPNSSEDSLLRAHVEARKLIAKCIEETVQLPSLGCR